MTSTDLTCNVNGLSGAGVATATIAAGTNITYVRFAFDLEDGGIEYALHSFIGLSGTNMPSGQVKMPFPVDTKDRCRSTLPLQPQRAQLQPSVDKDPYGPRFILRVF